jgi:hypothetical protein
MEESEDSTGFGFIAGVVILLIVLIVLTVFFFKVEDIRKADESIKRCKLSVEMSSATHIKGIDVYDQLECPPNYIAIDGKSDESIKKTLANEMASCWYKFGGDSNELFGTGLASTRYCALCSHITFKGDSKNRQLTGFSYYLADQTTKSSYGGKTYMNFLSQASFNSADKESLVSRTDDTINTANDYGVVYIYDKEGDLSEVQGLFGGTAAGLVVGGVLILFPEPSGLTKAFGIMVISSAVGGGAGYAAGAAGDADWQAGVMLIPYTEEQFNNLKCEKLPISQENRQ